jgi:phosphohistidine phosphatase
VVAHDPGMSVLAGWLSDDGIAHMPTCAVARFEWDDDDWDVASSVAPASWSLDTPR